MEKLKVLDLFSGIGGFSLGLERTGGFETVAFCEIEEFPRKILAKHWPEVPIYDDVRELRGSDVGPIDLICGGYPCQPFSHAGKRLGENDDRHLWPEFARLISELRPDWAIGENVAGHISMGLDNVLSDLEILGYTARTFVIPACAVGAKHRRDRTWVVANNSGGRQLAQAPGQVQQSRRTETQRSSEDVANTEGQRPGEARQHSKRSAKWVARSRSPLADTKSFESNVRELEKREAAGRFQASIGGSNCETDVSDTLRIRQSRSRGAKQPINSTQERNWQERGTFDACGWLIEPNVGRVANGVPNGVDRLKALGNAVVPQIPELIGYAILDAIKDNTFSEAV